MNSGTQLLVPKKDRFF